MNISVACEYPVQPEVRDEDRRHPRFAEYLRYRDAFARQLVTAPTFAMWLQQHEAFEHERVFVFQVQPGEEIAPGWYVNFFPPLTHEPEQFGPYPTEERARQTEQWLLAK